MCPPPVLDTEMDTSQSRCRGPAVRACGVCGVCRSLSSSLCLAPSARRPSTKRTLVPALGRSLSASGHSGGGSVARRVVGVSCVLRVGGVSATRIFWFCPKPVATALSSVSVRDGAVAWPTGQGLVPTSVHVARRLSYTDYCTRYRPTAVGAACHVMKMNEHKCYAQNARRARRRAQATQFLP